MSTLSPKVEEVFDRLAMMRDGKFDLSWMHANPGGWGTRPVASAGGLTLGDINVGPYGVVPEHGSLHGSMAPRALSDPAAERGPHPVLLEGEHAAWREMVENIRAHGGADLQHTLNYLTLPDWPLRLAAIDPEAGQLDVDRFYRYAATLQAFFDGAAGVETEFVEASAAA